MIKNNFQLFKEFFDKIRNYKYDEIHLVQNVDLYEIIDYEIDNNPLQIHSLMFQLSIATSISC